MPTPQNDEELLARYGFASDPARPAGKPAGKPRKEKKLGEELPVRQLKSLASLVPRAGELLKESGLGVLEGLGLTPSPATLPAVQATAPVERKTPAPTAAEKRDAKLRERSVDPALDKKPKGFRSPGLEALGPRLAGAELLNAHAPVARERVLNVAPERALATPQEARRSGKGLGSLVRGLGEGVLAGNAAAADVVSRGSFPSLSAAAGELGRDAAGNLLGGAGDLLSGPLGRAAGELAAGVGSAAERAGELADAGVEALKESSPKSTRRLGEWAGVADDAYAGVANTAARLAQPYVGSPERLLGVPSWLAANLATNEAVRTNARRGEEERSAELKGGRGMGWDMTNDIAATLALNAIPGYGAVMGSKSRLLRSLATGAEMAAMNARAPTSDPEHRFGAGEAFAMGAAAPFLLEPALHGGLAALGSSGRLLGAGIDRLLKGRLADPAAQATAREYVRRAGVIPLTNEELLRLSPYELERALKETRAALGGAPVQPNTPTRLLSEPDLSLKMPDGRENPFSPAPGRPTLERPAVEATPLSKGASTALQVGGALAALGLPLDGEGKEAAPLALAALTPFTRSSVAETLARSAGRALSAEEAGLLRRALAEGMRVPEERLGALGEGELRRYAQEVLAYAEQQGDRATLRGAHGVNPRRLTPQDVPEVAFQQVDPAAFHAAITAAGEVEKGGVKVKDNLTIYSPEEYAQEGWRTFLSADGRTGYALKPDGDLISVFNVGERGAGSSAVLDGVQRGATKLDAFEPALPEIYNDLGFKTVRREANWSLEEGGRPARPVTYMEYRGGDPATLRERIGSFGPDQEPRLEFGDGEWPHPLRAELNERGAATPVAGERAEQTPQVRVMAEDYRAQHGKQLGLEDDFDTQTYHPVPEEEGRAIADWYEAQPATPETAAEKIRFLRSINAFNEEVALQYQHATQNGMRFERWPHEGQPYANSAEALKDIRDNNRLYYYAGDLVGPEHPSGRVDPRTGLTPNEMFRAIHDYYGHGLSGNQFGARGEHNAAIEHAAMFSPEARPAMLALTRGQNSWVNYGPHLRRADGSLPLRGDPDWIHPAKRPFAQQKHVLLPEQWANLPRRQMEALPPEVQRAGAAAEGVAETAGELPSTRLRNTLEAVKAEVARTEEGGATFNRDFSPFEGQGYVATLASKNVPASELTPEAVEAFAREYQEVMGEIPGLKVGVFKLEGKDAYSIDLNGVFTDRAEALHLAKRTDQQSIYDLYRYQTIAAGGSGENTRPLSAAEVRELLAPYRSLDRSGGPSPVGGSFGINPQRELSLRHPNAHGETKYGAVDGRPRPPSRAQQRAEIIRTDPMLAGLGATGHPSFYSRLGRAIANAAATLKLEGKALMRGQGWLRAIEGAPEGVLKHELEFTGVLDWLKENRQRKITPEELARYFEENRIEVREVERSANPSHERLLENPEYRSAWEKVQELEAEAARRSAAVQEAQARGWQALEPFGLEPDVMDDLLYWGTTAENLLRAAWLRNPELDEAALRPAAEAAAAASQETRTLWTHHGALESRLASARESLAEAKSDLAPKWEGYTQEGGENYREILLTHPARGGGADHTNNHWDGTPNVIAHLRLKDRTWTNPRTGKQEKVLFIEEVQSDWHQQARKYGSKPVAGGPQQRALRQRALQAEAAARKVLLDGEADMGGLGFILNSGTVRDHSWHHNGGFSEAEIEAVNAWRHAMMRAEGVDPKRLPEGYTLRQVDDGWEVRNVEGKYTLAWGESQEEASERAAIRLMSGKELRPEGPLEETGRWAGLAIKRVLDLAVDGGYDRVAWASGSQAAKVNHAAHLYDAIRLSQRGEQWLIELSGNKSERKVVDSIEEARALLGDELTDKLLAKPSASPEGVTTYLLQGDEMLVGDGPMRAYYGGILPELTEAQLARLDRRVKLEKVNLGLTEPGAGWEVFDRASGRVRERGLSDVRAAEALDAANGPAQRGALDARKTTARQHSFALTPALAEAVRKRRFELMSLGAGLGAAGTLSKQDNEETSGMLTAGFAGLVATPRAAAKGFLRGAGKVALERATRLLLSGAERRLVTTGLAEALAASPRFARQGEAALAAAAEQLTAYAEKRGEIVQQVPGAYDPVALAAGLLREGNLTPAQFRSAMQEALGDGFAFHAADLPRIRLEAEALSGRLPTPRPSEGGAGDSVRSLLSSPAPAPSAAELASPSLSPLPGRSADEHIAWLRAEGQAAEADALERFHAGNQVREVVMHGTTHDFDTFNIGRTNADGYMGRGGYFTSSPEDMSGNYATLGPDAAYRARLKAETLREEILADPARYGLDPADPRFGELLIQKAWELAKREVAGPHAGAGMPAYIRLTHPIVLEPGGGTVLAREPLLQALRAVAGENGYPTQAIGEIAQRVAGELEESPRGWDVMKAVHDALMEFSDQTDAHAPEVMRQVFERLGHDGTILDAYAAFGPTKFARGMNYVTPGTRHYTVFSAEQVKSATGNRGTYSLTDPNILHSFPGAAGLAEVAKSPAGQMAMGAAVGAAAGGRLDPEGSEGAWNGALAGVLAVGAGRKGARELMRLARGKSAALTALERSRTHVLTQLSEALGVPITVGPGNMLARQALGAYVQRPEVIRLRYAQDVQEAVGRSAQHLLKLLDGSLASGAPASPLLARHETELRALVRGKAKPSRIEGAEAYFRQWVAAPQATEARAPGFTAEVMRRLEAEQPAVWEALQTARRHFELRNSAPGEANLGSRISTRTNPERASMQDRWDRLVTTVLDDVDPVRRMVDDLTRGSPRWEQNAAALMRLTRGANGIGEVMLEAGTLDYATMQVKGPGLKQILAPVTGDAATQEAFTRYVVARRADELGRLGIETGLEAPWVAETLANHQGNAAFATAFDQLVQYNRHLLEYLRDGGVLSAESFQRITQAHQEYVPFLRVVEGGGGGGGGLDVDHLFSPVKRMTGSTRDIVDPLESMVKNTFLYSNLVARQEVSRSLARLAEIQGAGRYLEEIKAPTERIYGALSRESKDEILAALKEKAPGDAAVLDEIMQVFRPGDYYQRPDVISVLRPDGRRAWYQVRDQAVLEALGAMEKEQVQGMAKFASHFAATLRAGATLAPEFGVSNPLRDQLAAAIQSRSGYRPFWDFGIGLAHLLGKDEGWLKKALTTLGERDDLVQKWLSGGGGGATLVAGDRAALRERLGELLGSDARLKDVVKTPLHLLQVLSEFSEQSTRVGEFRRALQKLEAEGVTGRELYQRAALEAREVSTDFQRHGARTKNVRMMAAFWNARLQGYSRMARGARADPVGFAARGFGWVTVPTVLNYMANRDDPEYFEIPRWQRDLFWMVRIGDEAETNPKTGRPRGRWLRIPKPFELGTIFGSLPERLLEYLDTEDPQNLAETVQDLLGWAPGTGQNTPQQIEGFLSSNVGHMLLPDFTAAQPVVESLVNYSRFRQGPIVDGFTEGLAPEYQGGERSTLFARELGRAAGLSPARLDNIFLGWTGGLGRLGAQAGEGFATRAGWVEPGAPRPAPELADLPGVRALAARSPFASSESGVRYKQMKDRAGEAARTSDYLAGGPPELVGRGDEALSEELTRYTDRNLEALTEAEKVQLADRDLTRLRRAIHVVRNDPTLSPEEKRAQIRELEQTLTQAMSSVVERRYPREGSRLDRVLDPLLPKRASLPAGIPRWLETMLPTELEGDVKW